MVKAVDYPDVTSLIKADGVEVYVVDTDNAPEAIIVEETQDFIPV